MTVTVNIPPEMEQSLMNLASTSQDGLEETILSILRDRIGVPMPSVPQLEPTILPDDDLLNDEPLVPVPLREVGVVTAIIVDVQPLLPTILPEDE